MSKSVAVIDTPENGCMDCSVCRVKWSKMTCGITGKTVSGNHERGGFPGDCPLKPMPKPMSYNRLDYYAEGWNGCIYEITGEYAK